ncbi:MAG: DNA polymerase III subunit gamma and tau [Bacteroidetes bacterium OLB11]|nr:MAG: DNA polymerase III subunit gamma and tau [Bacteroidetes bacterium OLB11]
MSSKYVVSAIKYRPQRFNTVVGQSHITTTLKNAIKQNQLAHSFLFCGPRGVGKTTCARILAKTINCTNLTNDAEACDECPSCISYRENTSFNVHEIDAASNNSVEDIRNLIEQVRYLPLGGSKYKVYIIDEVHMLSLSAFNAFLKTLEEPPKHAIFILATTEKHKILPTILSRCQIFDFNRITIDDTITHLSEICTQEHIQFEKDALHLIAQKSEGCMRDSLSIMDKIANFTQNLITYENTIEHLNILDYDYFFKLTESFLMQDLSNVLLNYETIFSKGFEGDSFLNGFTEHFRNLLICKDDKIAHLLQLPQSIKTKYYQQANQISGEYIINALSILNEAEINYKEAINKRLHVELALIKINYLSTALQVIREGDQLLKKKF